MCSYVVQNWNETDRFRFKWCLVPTRSTVMYIGWIGSPNAGEPYSSRIYEHRERSHCPKPKPIEHSHPTITLPRSPLCSSSLLSLPCFWPLSVELTLGLSHTESARLVSQTCQLLSSSFTDPSVVGCNVVAVACYAGSGAVFGTITAGVGVAPAILACNAALGTCSAACATVALLAPTP